ncbi:MAG: hypothetical protein ACUVX8_15020 [Candidatus Zipacnadales bacterium]
MILLLGGQEAWANTTFIRGLAYWEPDRGTPYDWFESAQEMQSFFAEDYQAAGFIKAYILNAGDAPVSLSTLRLNGRPLDALRESHEVIWWRLLPDPLPAQAVGEIVVRLRGTLRERVELTAKLSDGSEIGVTVGPEPRLLRIETVGFNNSMDRLFLVIEALDGKTHRARRLLLDNQPVPAKLLDPEFATGICPISVDLDKPLVEGSYHTYTVEVDETSVACCVRTYDGWVPLGTYGYTEFEEFARNGCNGHNNFGRYTKAQLDIQATLLMRGVHIIRDSLPEDFTIGHPGLWAFCLMDEPDCQDYFHAEEWPVPMRIGYHAMTLERQCQACRKADPTKPTFLTLDLTYKPANFYIYGPLADITNVDCYTRSIGADLRMVREVVETARYGAGPHPLTFTFESYHLDPGNPSEPDGRRFPRPPTAEELRLSIYYALGAGARGLYNYIHCTEKWKQGLAHGTKDYPDLWREIGRCYREIDVIAPLVALAHPMQLATCADEKVWLHTLIAGPEALLIVCANEDYDEERLVFRSRPRKNVRLRLPTLPWLVPQAAWRVTEDGLQLLEVAASAEGVEIALDRLEVAELVLVARNRDLGHALWTRHVELDRDRAEALLRAWRLDQDREARKVHAVRRLEGEFADRVIIGRPLNAYGAQPEGYWNPTGEQQWAFEFGQNEEGEAPPQGVEWVINVSTQQSDTPCSIYVMCGIWGEPAQFVLRFPDGEKTVLGSITGSFGSGELVRLFVTFPMAGEYRLSFLQEGMRPRGGRVACAIYLIPEKLGPPEVP